MAAYDAQASNVTGGDAAANPSISAATLSFTGAAGASVVAFIETSAESVNVSACTVSATYNGSTATGLATQAPGSTTAKSFLVGWLNICDGAAHNIAVTVSGANLPHQITIGAISATGVGSFSGATSSAPGILTNSGNLAVTSTGTADLVVSAGAHGDLISGTSNGTQRWIQNPASLSAGGDSVGSTIPGAAGTVNAGGYTSAASDHWTLLAVNLVAGTAVVPNVIPPRPPAPSTRRGQVPISRLFRQTDTPSVSNDVSVTGLLDLGGVIYATHTQAANVTGLLETAEFLAATGSHDATVAANLPIATVPYGLISHAANVAGVVPASPVLYGPVSHDATLAGLLPAGLTPYGPVSHAANVAGLLELGVFALNGPSFDVTTTGLLLAGIVPLATATRTADVAGLLPAGITPLSTVSHDATAAGLLPAGSVLYGPVSRAATVAANLALGSVLFGPASHAATVTGLLEAGVFALSGPNFDYNAVGWLPIGVAPRSTITTARTVAGLLPTGVSIESTITATRGVAGLLGWGVSPSGLMTRTVSVAGYLPSGLILVALIAPEIPPGTFLLLPHVISGLPYILTGRERGVIDGRDGVDILTGQDRGVLDGGDDPIISGGAR